MHVLRSRLSDERGFTLVELMVATLIATIVLLAAFKLVDLAVGSQVENENRLEAVQRGRQAMELVGRDLRSQICPARNQSPIQVAENDRIVFYASLAPAPSSNAPLTIEKRELAFEVPAGATRGQIVERVYKNQAIPPAQSFPAGATPDRTNVLADNLTRVNNGPIFRYWKYDPALSPNLLPLTPPIADTDRALVVQVGATFDSWSTGGRIADKVHTQFDSKVFVRTADPTDPEHSPRCI
jgi:prepilin-type N-terminal cleavage/methylation domain-containing protein